MIKKIKSITNVGKHKSLRTEGGTETDFEKFVPLLGPNAKGKSTLSAIFSSLRSGNSDLIIGRRTFQTTADQIVSIEMVDAAGQINNLIFRNSNWQTTYPNIEVFDNRFVANNVYISEKINEEHEKNVQSVILGEEGQKLEETFIKADQECQKSSNRKAEITREYTKHLGHYQVEFKVFCELPIDDEAQQKLDAIQQQTNAHKNKTKIEAELTKLDGVLDVSRFVQMEKDLAGTISSTQAKIKAHIQSHIVPEKQSDEKSINDFLSAGTQFLKDDQDSEKHCSFCGQELDSDAVGLIEEYEKLFSEEYRNLSSAQKGAEQYLKNWKLNIILASHVAELKALGVELDLIQEMQELDTQIQLLLAEVQKKSDLSYCVNFDSLTEITDILKRIGIKVAQIKSQYSSNDSRSVLAGLIEKQKQLELQKKRGEKPWIDLCKEYQDLEANWKKLQQNRDDALKARSDYAKQILQNYETEVNTVLSSLGADFKLTEMKPKEGLRRSSPLFYIAFDQDKISLNSSTDNIAHFGNTLSESDKRLLAFAFFIACIKVQGNIIQKIIILDDPVCSLDHERKYNTSVFLKRFMDQEKPEQLVVLTHDRHFMSLLSKSFEPTKCFKLIHDPASQSSKIELLNPNDEFLDNYYRQIQALKLLETAPDHEVTWDKLRPIRDIIEQVFKRKYYLKLQAQIQANASIQSFVQKLIEDGVYTSERAKSLEDLLPHFWNHDDSTSSISRDEFSAGDLKSIVGDFFSAIEMI